jgi:AcrR family transcriptional regulator
MDLGFDGASMGEIARAAGVSKGTLYVYFADKNRLFEAIVEEESLEQGRLAFNFDPERDVPTTLRDFGQAYIQLDLPARRRIGDPHRDGDRRADARCRPPLLRMRAGKDHRPPRRLSRGARGGKDLAIDDCQLAASQFPLMCQASLFLPFIFQAAPPPSPERIDASGRKRDADVSRGNKLG